MSTEEPTPRVRRLDVWDVLLIVAALSALIILTLYTARHYAGDATKAATVLGIVVPAFATIGAAAFGVTVAYSAGQAQGQARGQADKDAAVMTAKADAAELLSDPLDAAERRFGEISRLVQERAYSPPGSRALLLGVRAPTKRFDLGEEATVELQPEPLEVEASDLDEIRESLARMRGVANALRSGR